MDACLVSLVPVKSVPAALLAHKFSCPNLLARCSSGDTDADSRSSSPRAHGHTSALSQLLRELRQSRSSLSGHNRGEDAPDTPSFLADVAVLQSECHGGNRWCSPQQSPRQPGLGAQHAFFTEETHAWRSLHSNGSGGSSCSTSGTSSPTKRASSPKAALGFCARQRLRRQQAAARKPLALLEASGRASGSGGRSISRAKAVLAEAIRGTHSGRCLVDAPSLKDTGVLSPLLAMIRAASGHPHSSCGGAATSSALAPMTPPPMPSSCRMSPFAAAAFAAIPASPPASVPDPASEAKVMDCLDTVCLLAVDEANRQALLELGAVPLMLSKLQPGASSTAVVAGALRALAALSRGAADKRRVWADEQGRAWLLALLRGQRGAAVTAAAFTTVAHLGWESATVPPTLLEPGLVVVLSALLHPNAEGAVLLPALELLTRAAQSADAARLPGWQHCIFKLAPLLVASSRPGSTGVVAAAVGLLIELAEAPELRCTLCAAGCLPPLLALVFDNDASLGSSAACLLTTLIHTRMGQERLCEEAALVMLLQVLQERETAVDLKLGALYVLRCLALDRPGIVPLLKLHSALRTLQRLLQQGGLDADVQHGAASLLRAMGAGQQLDSRPAAQQQLHPVGGHAGQHSVGNNSGRRCTEGGVHAHSANSAPDFSEQQRRRAQGSASEGGAAAVLLAPLLGGGCLRSPLPPSVPAAVCK